VKQSITSPVQDTFRPRGMMRCTLTGIVLLLLLSLFWLGTTIKNDNYDAYDYMAGARALAQSEPSWYPSIRPFGPSLLGAGWTALMRDQEQADLLFRVLHFQSTILTFLFLWVSVLLYRRFGRTGPLLPLVLLSLCRLLPRYGWSFLSDIPASLLVALGFLFLLSDKKRGRQYLWAGLCFGLAANFKFYLILSIPLGAVTWLWVHRDRRRHALALLLSGLFVAVGVHLLAAISLGGGHLPGLAFWKEIFGGQFLSGTNMAGAKPEEWWAYLPLLIASCGLLAPGFLLLGFVEAIRRRSPGEKVVLIWFVGLGTVLLIAGHHEARYLFPILVPLIWLVTLGILKVGGWLSSPKQNRMFPVIIVALVAAGWPAVQEALGLSESWLRLPIQQKMCNEITSRSDGCNTPLCVAPFYPLILAKEVFSPHDAYYSIFHLGASQIIFWEEVDASFVVASRSSSGYWLPSADFPPVEDARLLVVSGYHWSIDAVSLDQALEYPRPLVLIREETEVYQCDDFPQGGTFQTREVNRRPQDGRGKEPERLLQEDFFVLGEGGRLQPLSPALGQRMEESSTPPACVFRRHYNLLSAEISP